MTINPNIAALSTDQQQSRAQSLIYAAWQSGMTDPAELSNFMGQVQHESQQFTRLEENLRYSGSRLYDVFGDRNGLTRARASEISAMTDRVARDRTTAEQVYGGEWGRENLGNTETGDGYQFRGRGYIQLTGRENYDTIGSAAGLDLIANPALAANESNAEQLALTYWQERVADRNPDAVTDVRQAGALINGTNPPNGLADRQNAADAWGRTLSGDYLDRVIREQSALSTDPDPVAIRSLPADQQDRYWAAHADIRQALEASGHAYTPQTLDRLSMAALTQANQDQALRGDVQGYRFSLNGDTLLLQYNGQFSEIDVAAATARSVQEQVAAGIQPAVGAAPEQGGVQQQQTDAQPVQEAEEIAR